MSQEIFDNILKDIWDKIYFYAKEYNIKPTHCILPYDTFIIIQAKDTKNEHYWPAYTTKDFKSRLYGMELIIYNGNEIKVGVLK